jgi:hypothetical protein
MLSNHRNTGLWRHLSNGPQIRNDSLIRISNMEIKQ